MGWTWGGVLCALVASGASVAGASLQAASRVPPVPIAHQGRLAAAPGVRPPRRVGGMRWSEPRRGSRRLQARFRAAGAVVGLAANAPAADVVAAYGLRATALDATLRAVSV